jgi:D-arabinose 1-dehydrogenase-like Zn-dependent alcohol dehydrogenase
MRCDWRRRGGDLQGSGADGRAGQLAGLHPRHGGRAADLDPFLAALKRDGAMVLVGAPEHPHPAPTVFNLIMKRRTLAGSLIGGIRETQEMLDFCARHGIVADIEMIRMDQIQRATHACSRAR